MSQGFTKPLTLPLPVNQGGTGVTTIPSFSAYQSSTQSIAANGYTKVQLPSEQWDTGSYFDSSTNYRYTPLVAGTYQVDYLLTLADTFTSTDYGVVIYKNGSLHKWGTFNRVIVNSQVFMGGGSSLIQFNGSTDYIEMYCYNSHATNTVTVAGDGSGSSQVFLAAVWVGA